MSLPTMNGIIGDVERFSLLAKAFLLVGKRMEFAKICLGNNFKDNRSATFADYSYAYLKVIESPSCTAEASDTAQHA